MRVSIFGLGYVGTVTAACLARDGHEVVGVDVNPDKVSIINAGRSPIVEPGLGELIADVVAARRLRATVSVDFAVEHSDLAMICVGTPSGRNGQIDTSAIERVASEIGGALARHDRPFTIVLRSTVLPGTTETVLAPILRGHLPDFDARISLAVNPEFMREGTSIADFERPPITLIGCSDTKAEVRLRMLYRHVNAPFVHTSLKVAEMAKYVSNAFHALKICFANEIGDLCESLGVEAQEVTNVFLRDRKLNISEAYLRPGFAFGGSCLPKDLRALLHAARRADLPLPLLGAITESNEQQIRNGIDAVLSTHKKRVAVVGLAFKSGTDDLRESPMVTLVEHLIGKGCAVTIYDPNVRLAALVGANREYIEKEIPHVSSVMCDDLDTMLDAAEVIVIGSPSVGAERAAALRTRGKVVIDLTRGFERTASSAATTEDAGLTAAAVGA